jgi:predicted transcriptional regulator
VRRAFPGLEKRRGFRAASPTLPVANALTEPPTILKLTSMEVHLKPETASRLAELASKSGRATDDLMEDAMAGYLQELTEAREMLDSRYDDIKSGRVSPIDGETFFDNLRQREDELLKKRNLK